MAFFKYGATVNIKKQASLDIIAKDVPEVSHTADKISAKKDDNFVYFWTRAVSADVPNLNSDLFPLDELKKAYPTFIGRGLYMDHNAQSVANAVGKVFDAKLLEDPTATEEEGRYYVGCLCGVDKTTHPDIAAKVAHGVIDSVSMGASCGSCQCNICNRVCHTPEEFCVHLQHQGQIDPETGKKCISINRDVNFSELSLVGVPADPMAKMQQVFAEFVGGLNKSASLEKEAENSFLEKFSFSIPCGNEKICETLFNVLTGYKKQGISDLSMDGSILKLSVEAKNEDLAKQKLEKISEEQGLDVEKPLQKEEKSMSEEIKPVEEQVENKSEVQSNIEKNEVKQPLNHTARLMHIHKIKAGYSNNPDYYGDWFGDGQIDFSKVIDAEAPGDIYMVKIWGGSGYVLDVYLVKANDYEEAIDKVFEWSYNNEGKNNIIFDREYLAKDCHEDYETDGFLGEGKPSDTMDYEEFEERWMEDMVSNSDYSLFARAENFFVDKVPAEYLPKEQNKSYSHDVESSKTQSNGVKEVKAEEKVASKEEVKEDMKKKADFDPTVSNEDLESAEKRDEVETQLNKRLLEIMEEAEQYGIDTQKLLSEPNGLSNILKELEEMKSYSHDVESSKTQSNGVKEVKAEENKETKKEDLVPGVSKEDTKKDIKHDLAKEKEEAKGGEDETKDIETLEKAIKETDKGALSKVIDLLKKFIGGEAKEGEDLKDYKSDDLVKKLEEKPADKKASLNKKAEGEKTPAVQYRDFHTGIHHLALFNTREEALEAVKLLKQIQDTEYPEGQEGEDDYIMDMHEAFATSIGDIEVDYRTVQNDPEYDIVNKDWVIDASAKNSTITVQAKPEVPAQPVPEVKEEVEEKKEEVKPSKDVKTKEDAVKVLEDVLKAGEEADVKELGKVLDFLKSDKKEEKKEEVKEEKVEEKAEPKKEEPFKEEKKEEVKDEAKPLFANVTRVSLLKTANLIDSKWVFHFKGTDKVACLSVKNLLPGVSEKVAYLTSKEFYNEMMDTLTKKQAFDGEAVKQIVANYNEKIKVGSDEAKSQVSKATSKAKNETDGKKVSDTSKAVDTKLTDDGKEQKQDKVNSKEDAGAIESATKKAPAETDIKVSAELEAKCKQLMAALEAKEAEVSQMKMQQELAAKTAKARQIVEKSIKCGLVQCNETFRQEELLKQASPLKAKEEAMKRTADSMVADLLALSDEELDKQASYLSNFKVEAEVKQLKPIKIEASCEQSEDEDLIKALGAEMW